MRDLFRKAQVFFGLVLVLSLLLSRGSVVYAQSGRVPCPVNDLGLDGFTIDNSKSDQVAVMAGLTDQQHKCVDGARLTFDFTYGVSGKMLEKTTRVSRDSNNKFVGLLYLDVNQLHTDFPVSTSVSVHLVVSSDTDSLDFGTQDFVVPDASGTGGVGNNGGDNNNNGGGVGNNGGNNNNNSGGVGNNGGNNNSGGVGNNGGPGSSSNCSGGSGGSSGSGDTALQNPICYSDLVSLFFAVMHYMLLAVGALTVAVIIYGGIQMVLSRGNEGAITEAKKTLTYAIAGLLIAILSYSIVGIIQNIIGVK